MSITRYNICTPRSDAGDSDFDYREDPSGGWVDFTGHAAAIENKDAEIARLKEQLAALLSVPDENMLRDAGELVQDVDDDAAEIAKLRKVAEAAKNYLLAQKLDLEAAQLAAHADFGSPGYPPALEKYYRFAHAASLHEWLADFYERRLHSALAELDEAQ